MTGAGDTTGHTHNGIDPVTHINYNGGKGTGCGQREPGLVKRHTTHSYGGGEPPRKIRLKGGKVDAVSFCSIQYEQRRRQLHHPGVQ